MESVNQIKQHLSSVDLDKIPEAIKIYLEDERISVKKLIEQYQKKYIKYQNELQRIKEISKYETELYQKGKNYIAGIDEVGRGPLAGPVMTCAVILPKDCNVLGINDSKKLSASQRENICIQLKKIAIDISISKVEADEIDKINILQSVYKSMKQSVNNLNTKPDIVLVDAVSIPDINVEQLSIVKGDAKSISIAAASIIAKVTRDKLMDEYSKKYPEYGFERNKGYGTKEHIDAIKEYGLCPIHRRTFVKNLEVLIK